MKKLLSSRFLAIVVALLAFTSAVAADVQYNGLSFNVVSTPSTTKKNVEVTYVTSSYNSYSGDIVIPETFYVGSVTYTVVKIGTSAFRDCTSLSSVVIPSTVTSIDSYAFYGCYWLRSIIIPASVTSIGSNAFYNCSNLEHVVSLSSSITPTGQSSSYGYLTYYAKVVVSRSNAAFVGDFMFVGNTLAAYVGRSTSNIVLPDDYNGNTYSVGPYAFYKNSTFTSLTIPQNCTSVDRYAFNYCSRLNSININSDLVVTTALTSSYALSSPFEGSAAGTKVSFGRNVTSVGGYLLFSCSNVTSIDLPYGLKSIGNHAFYGCKPEMMRLPASLRNYSGILYGCDMQQLIVEEGVDSSQFSDAFSDSEDSSNKTSFRNLKYIKIPDSIDPASLIYTYDACPDGEDYCWATFNPFEYNPAIALSQTNPYAVIENGLMMNKAHTTLIMVTRDAPADIVIPATITQYRSGFSSLDNIRSIKGVRSTSSIAISNCPKLEEVEIEAQRISFYNCPMLSKVNWTGGKYIGDYAFRNCPSLKCLFVPETVNEIYKDWLCYSNIENVYLLGSTPPSGWYWDDYYDEYRDHQLASPYPGINIMVAPEALSTYLATNWWAGVKTYAPCITRQPTDTDPHVEVFPADDATYQWCTGGGRMTKTLDLNATSTGSYKWTASSDGKFVSSNKNVDGSSCTSSETISVESGDVLTVNWQVSSESGYDWLYVRWGSSTLISKSGSDSGIFTYTFKKDETANLVIEYSKDGSQSSGNDCAWVSASIDMTSPLTPIEGQTSQGLDLSAAANGDKVFCVVTTSAGTQVTSNEITVNKTANVYYLYSANYSSGYVARDIAWDDLTARRDSYNRTNSVMVVNSCSDGEGVAPSIVYLGADGKYRATAFEFTDSYGYYSPIDFVAATTTYTRNYKTTDWQDLCLPFDMPAADISALGEVAQLYNVHYYPEDGIVLEFTSVTDGTVKAGKPYLFKPAEAGEMTFTANDAFVKNTMSAATNVECRSTSEKFTYWGAERTQNLGGNCYTLSGNKFVKSSSTTVSPFRAMLEVSALDSYAAVQGKRMARATAGEEILLMIDGQVLGRRLMGDVDSDGDITVTDVVCIVNKVLSVPVSDFDIKAADLDGDGDITITDVVITVNKILKISKARGLVID